MKVLQINSVCGIGSTGRIATDIHGELTKRGYDSYIAYGRGKPNNIDSKYTIKIGGKISQFMHLVKTRVFDRHGFGSRIATVKLIRKIRKLDPDIIHLHNLHGYYINIQVLFKYLKSSKKKIIMTLHDCWTFTGHSAHFSFPKVDGWVNGIHNCLGKSNYPKSFICDNKSKNSKDKLSLLSGVDDLTIITPSSWLKNLVDNSYLNQYTSKVINNGIDVNLYRKTPENLRDKMGLKDKFVILGVASPFTQKKGFDYFLELSKSISDNDVIILVGLNSKQLKHLPNNVIGIKKTTNQFELVSMYSSANVYLNLTLEDTFPTTNIEAMACGLPVLTFNTGGSPEIINKKTGMVLNDMSINTIIDEIEKIKNETIVFSKEDSINRVIKLYNKNDKINEYIREYLK